ncbi:integumentary mucin C.1-like [Maniola jurtina]|uniref:integumentary mucin C.1-like n=1 Tax=Maniola jurtina TaxID=191418 RepID=UPI001E689134|nr:integumentary mucin C.1-like [Maniola jurtina]
MTYSYLFRFSFLFCSTICLTVSSSSLLRQDVKIGSFGGIASLCKDDNLVFARSRKLFCIICKGFDASCFSTTSTTTTSTPSTSTTTSSTTPASTTTSSTTTPASTTSSTTTTTTEAPPTE